MSKSPNSRYVPREGATEEEKAECAFNCGSDLNSNDLWSYWIDLESNPDVIDAYHAGQAWRYENESW